MNWAAKKLRKSLRAFTLVEVLMAATIFTAVSLIAMTVFVNVLRIQRRVELENAIYEDSRFMMERLSREIRENTVDYEEYYNKLVENKHLGETYGCYASRFYDPGKFQGQPDDFGAKCNDGTLPKNNPGCTLDKNSLDINTYQNPYLGYSTLPSVTTTTSNAFCDENHLNNPPYSNCTTVVTQLPQNPPQTQTQMVQKQLYLINAKGTEKTYLALKEMNGASENSVSLLRLTGKDSDNDGLTDQWSDSSLANPYLGFCSAGFDCSSVADLESTLQYNGANNYLGFVPISPSRTNITNLLFYISPIEDPRKAAAETDPLTQQQPHVTVVMTVKPSISALQGYNGEIPSITLQTTVTSRVYNDVTSFTPTNPWNVCANYN